MTSYGSEYFPAGLFAQAIAADSRADGSVEIGEVWQDLSHDRSRIAASFHTSERCYLVLRSTGKGALGWLNRERVAMFERVLLEASQYAVAVEEDLAPSTIALTSRRCLEAMGLSCRAFGVPLLIVIAVHAAHGKASPSRARLVPSLACAEDCRVVSLPRPDRELLSELSPAEREVAGLLVEGMTYAEIAERRDTSLRTVANQLTATFRRLGVSGRLELLRWLAMPFELRRPPAPPLRRSRPEARPVELGAV